MLFQTRNSLRRIAVTVVSETAVGVNSGWRKHQRAGWSTSSSQSHIAEQQMLWLSI
jgi:hypothetical protein